MQVQHVQEQVTHKALDILFHHKLLLEQGETACTIREEEQPADSE